LKEKAEKAHILLHLVEEITKREPASMPLQELQTLRCTREYSGKDKVNFS
jgi:hypothetical protein